MTEKELKAAIKSPIGGFFFFGDEDYLKKHYTAEIQRNVIKDEALNLFNESYFDDESFTAAAFAEALATPPIMNEKKLVRLNFTEYSVSNEKSKAGLYESLCELKNYPKTVVVINISPGGFDGGTPKRPSSQLNKLSKIINCTEFTLQTEAKLSKWLIRHFLDSGLILSDKCARYMIRLCGRDMHRLLMEADKTTAYALSGGLQEVDEGVISLIVSRTPEEDAFQLANAVLSGNCSAALESLSRAKRRNESPVRLLASISAVFCDMAVIAHLASLGDDKRTISSKLKIHEYRTGLYMKAAEKIRLADIDRAVELCSMTDRKLKSSSSLGYIPLENLICKTARLRFDKDT